MARVFSLLLLLAFPYVASAATAARNAIDIIAREGHLDISDGISILTFKKGGAFELVPMFQGGRFIKGTWKVVTKEPCSLYVEGEWRWLAGYQIPEDRRSILVDIGPIAGTKIHYARGTVYEAVFTIQTVRKASPPRKRQEPRVETKPSRDRGAPPSFHSSGM